MSTVDSVKQQIETLKNLLNTTKEPLNVNNSDLKNNLQLFITVATNRLNSIYANVLSEAKLINLSTYIQSINSSLNSYINYKPRIVGTIAPRPPRQQYLANIMPAYDAALTILMQIPTIQQNEAEQAFDIAINELRTKANDIINNLNQTNEKVANNISASLQKNEIIQKDIYDKKEQIDKLLNTVQDKFRQSEEIRSDEFKEKTVKQYQELDELKQKTKEIFGLAGKFLTEKSQKIYADEAKSFAVWSFIFGMSWMAFMFLIIFYPLIEHMWASFNHVIDWASIVYRVSTGFVLLLPSFYLLNESNKHRNIEQKYRELQIKLAAIGPYFSNVSDGVSKEGQTIPDKDLVKLEIAKSLLCPSKKVGKDDIVVNKNSISIIEKIIEIVTTKIAK